MLCRETASESTSAQVQEIPDAHGQKKHPEKHNNRRRKAENDDGNADKFFTNRNRPNATCEGGVWPVSLSCISSITEGKQTRTTATRRPTQQRTRQNTKSYKEVVFVNFRDEKKGLVVQNYKPKLHHVTHTHHKHPKPKIRSWRLFPETPQQEDKNTDLTRIVFFSASFGSKAEPMEKHIGKNYTNCTNWLPMLKAKNLFPKIVFCETPLKRRELRLKNVATTQKKGHQFPVHHSLKRLASSHLESSLTSTPQKISPISSPALTSGGHTHTLGAIVIAWGAVPCPTKLPETIFIIKRRAVIVALRRFNPRVSSDACSAS